MSFFFAKKSKMKPQFTGLQTQTSTSSVPVTLAYGKNRLAPNIIWQGDFKSHKHKQKAGKGGGGSSVSYTYSASFQLALCWGPITDVTHVWKDQSKETSYSALGFSLFTGTTPQSPWGYLTSAHPTEALGYPGIAHLDVSNYDLGQSNGLAQHSFEVESLLFGTAVNGVDADPAQMIDDFLTNPAHGAGFNTGIIDSSTFYSSGSAGTTGDSTFQTYCTALGLGLSPALVSQEKASDTLERWAKLCNTALVWTGYSLRFHPYGADTITANGVTYLPDFPVRYSLSDSDFIHSKDEDPIRFNRIDPADAYNSMSMVIANKNNEYNDLPVPWKDQGLIDVFKERKADSFDAKEITDPDMAAIIVAFIGERAAYIRNSFEFKLPIKYCRIEPMDVLQCTDVRLGTFYVLVTDVEEDEEGELKITADEFIDAVGSRATGSVQAVSNTPLNTAVAPGPVNPPIIFEPPSSLASTAQVWAAVSGGDGTTYNPNWGGCYVWLSTDGITYDQIGQIDTAARQGKLTANLATYGGTNPDTVNTLAVSLLMSNGDLQSASATDAAAGVTLCYVDGELLSFEVPTLTGTNAYNITNLYRGLYGSTIGAHLSGTNFARLDDQVFKYDLPDQYIGKTLHMKFQSYNIFGGGVQDLSACTDYTYTPTGAGYGTATGGVPQMPAAFSGSSGGGYNKLTWNANVANDNVTAYKIYRAVGASQPFGSATMIESVGPETTSYVDTLATPNQAYTYFVVATNAAGDSANTAGINLTCTATGTLAYVVPFGFYSNTVATEYFFGHVFTESVTFPANWSGAQGKLETNPAATFVITLQKNGVTCGTISISTAGAYTFATTGGTSVSFVAGDKLTGIGPATADASIADVLASLRGTRS